MTALLPEISQVFGIMGVMLVLGAFFSIQKGLLNATNIIYPLMNLTGASFLLFSLVFRPNLPSILIEIAWMSISIYGIVKITLTRCRA
jgi:hypothetical protein